jgi:hypothetical protein
VQIAAEAVPLGSTLDLPRDLLFDTLAKNAVVAPAHIRKLASAKGRDHAPQCPVSSHVPGFWTRLAAAAGAGHSMPSPHSKTRRLPTRLNRPVVLAMGVFVRHSRPILRECPNTEMRSILRACRTEVVPPEHLGHPPCVGTDPSRRNADGDPNRAVSTSRKIGCRQAPCGLNSATTITTAIVIPVVMVSSGGPLWLRRWRRSRSARPCPKRETGRSIRTPNTTRNLWMLPPCATRQNARSPRGYIDRRILWRRRPTSLQEGRHPAIWSMCRLG